MVKTNGCTPCNPVSTAQTLRLFHTFFSSFQAIWLQGTAIRILFFLRVLV